MPCALFYFQKVVKWCNIIDYEKISILAKRVCNQTLIIRNLVLKKIRGGRVNDNAVINYFKEYIAFESKLTDEIIQALESWDPN